MSVPQRLVSFFLLPRNVVLGRPKLVFLEALPEVHFKGQKHILSHRSRCPTNQPTVFPQTLYPPHLFCKPVLLSVSASEPPFHAVRSSLSWFCDTSHPPNSAPAAPQFCLASQRALHASHHCKHRQKLCRPERLSHDKEIPVSIRLDERANFVEPPSARIPS